MIKFGYTYHYEVRGFGPPLSDENRLGMWGFGIRLDPAFALAAQKVAVERSKWEWLMESAKKTSDRCVGYDGIHAAQTVNFWEDTLLLTNVSVAGNACGIDADRDDFKRLGEEYGPMAIEYHPHNVDSMGQAAVLLAIWESWYTHALAVLSEETP